uniref:RNA-directed DNA polymerase n=1 Tax=Sipha flava TaxID=143950 RepID=A0A2S2R528_9HEMI
MGAEHAVLVVADHVLPVDVLVGRSWLELPHVSYYKQGPDFVLETNSNIVDRVLSDPESSELVEVHTVEFDSELPKRSPITLLDINVGSQSTIAQREQLISLLNQYRDTFAKNLTELGCTNVLAMDIVETEGSVPVSQRPYRTSPSDRQIIFNILSEWRSCGLISDSTSPYASPVLLANKASGEKRLCVDYRRLNQQTVNCPYPMPDVDEQLSSLAKGNLFTTLDLSNRFLQIPLTPQSKEKTAFVTEQETAKFERMPFGLKGAPGMFQKLMNFVFRDLKQAGVVNLYLDDVILPSEDWDDMLSKLKQVLEALRGARLTLKPAKCTFGSPQLDYLGFRISKGVVQPGRKVDSIAKFPRPRDIHEVRRFLGLAGYFRRFIVGYAELSNPLNSLMKKDATFSWGEQQEAAFVALKSKLCEEPVVRMYDATAPITQVHTDASAVALSGILLQGDNEKQLHIVYAVSKRTTEAESKYHSSRLELYAIIWTLSTLRSYLLGVRFTVITDCQALIYLNLHKNVKPQVARWFELLQEFDFDIKYRPGSRMAHVDALSRAAHSEPMPPDSVENVLAQRLEVCLTLTVEERVRLMQQGDLPTRTLYDQIQNASRGENVAQDYQVCNGLVYRKYRDKLLLVVPKTMRKGIVIAAHDLQGHFAVERTVEKITEDYWFSGLWRYVKQHISMCLDCLVHKLPSGKTPGLLHPIPPGKRPFQVRSTSITLDLLKPV